MRRLTIACYTGFLSVIPSASVTFAVTEKEKINMNPEIENEDFVRQNRQQVKLYRINTSQYELREIGDLMKIINYIINNHRQANKDIADVDLNLAPIVLGNINYLLYTFSMVREEFKRP